MQGLNFIAAMLVIETILVLDLQLDRLWFSR